MFQFSKRNPSRQEKMNQTFLCQGKRQPFASRSLARQNKINFHKIFKIWRKKQEAPWRNIYKRRKYLKRVPEIILRSIWNNIKLCKGSRINLRKISCNSTWKKNCKWWSWLASDRISVSFELTKIISMVEGYKNYYYLFILHSILNCKSKCQRSITKL